MTHDDEREHIARMAAMLDRRSHTMTTNDDPDVRREATAQRATDPLREALTRDLNALRAAASRGPVSSREIFQMTDPMMDRLSRAAPPTPAETAGDALREHLKWYADTFCELGNAHECCGRMSEDDCSGCRARAALAAAPQPAPQSAAVSRAMIDSAYDALPPDAWGTIAEGEMERILMAALRTTSPQPAPVGREATMQREDVEALCAPIEKIVNYEYSERDHLIHNCGLGTIDMGQLQDLCAAVRALKAERDAARTLSDELDFLHHEGGDESIAREIERARNEAFAAGQEEMRERAAYEVAEAFEHRCAEQGWKYGEQQAEKIARAIRALPLREPGGA